MSHVGPVSPAAIDAFMEWVDAAAANAGRSFFSYLIVRENEGVALIKGVLIMNSVGDLFPYRPRSLIFGKYTAGYLEIQGGKDAVLTFVSNLLIGAIGVDEHKISMVQGPGYALTALRIDNPEGALLNSQARQSRSTLIGAMHGQSLGPAIDWLLRSASPPYDSLQDLCNDYRLGRLSSNSVVDVLAFHMTWIDQRSQIQAGQLLLNIALMNGLDKDLCTVGYRVLGTDRIFRRGSFSSPQFMWKKEDDLWIGTLSTSQKAGDVVQCFATYDGRAQHQAWGIDKKKPQNPRRAIYVMDDERLERLEAWLAPKPGQKGPKQHEFEFAVQALGWMLGFSAQHLDRQFGNPKAPDGIFVCDTGIVVVECTIGPFGPEKLSKLLARRNDFREQLTTIGHHGIPVECAIIAPLTAQELEIGRRAAIEFGIGFIAKDSLAILLLRTYRLPDANQLFQELQQAIHEKRELFAPQEET
jgi:hypothetical protein